jgi:integral membrane protein
MSGALTRFRVIAWIVGIMLLLLTWATWRDLIDHDQRPVALIGPVHGFLYMVYLVLAFDLARRARWTLGRTVLVLLAGTVPCLSFVAERWATRQVRGAAVGAAQS